ncbi:MAG TPA: S41 family peptidase [Gemmataceae bacterium]|nr:S41 family peptidase [Gemmataceae bacterium]
MSNLIDPVVLSAHPLLAVLLDASVKGVMVLPAAALLTLALRRRSAAVRHLVWSLAMVGLLGLPLLSLALPRWDVPVPAAWAAEPAPAAAESPPQSPAVAELPPRADPDINPVVVPAALGAPREDPVITPGPEQAVAPDAPPLLPGWAWPLVAWALGAVLAILPILVGLLMLRRLRRTCRRVADGPMAALLDQLASRMGLRRPVALLQSPSRSMPMTWGVWRPVILLPDGADAWPTERLRVVLLHELAHVQRGDCLTQVLACSARALHWFNPLAWLAVARMRSEQERACDDVVLNTGTGAADYAQHLLTVTSGLPSSFFVSPVALAMGRARRVEGRLRSILDTSHDRHPLGRRGAGLAVLAGLCLLLPLASVSFQPRAAAGPAPQAVSEEPADDPAGQDEKADSTAESSTAPAKTLADVRDKIRELYVRKLNDRELTGDAIKGMLAALNDPYSVYFAPQEYAQLMREVRGTLSGIGAQLSMKDDRLTVVTPLEDSPALKAGLRAGDVIVAIDGKATKGLEIAQAVRRIIGPKGSVVKLKVVHPGGKEEELAITRGQIQLRSITGFRRGKDDRWQFLLDPDNKIGYVQITQFSPTTVKDLRGVIRRLQRQGLKGLILDLRFCPGGLMQSAVGTCELFLARGTIVSIKGEHNPEQTWEAKGKDTLGDFPLVVLLNESTASAAEIVAGALRENHRATLVGTRSYGKGSVQQIIELDDKEGALKLTTAYYYLPGGRNIQRHPGAKSWGVDPTDGYYVPVDARQTAAMQKLSQERAILGQSKGRGEKLTPGRLAEDYADPQLAAALKTMTARVTSGKFEKVGKPSATMAADLRRREVRERREALLKQLEQANKELADLEKAGKEERPPKEKQ